MDISTSPYRVMIVCTGNICRSPMAEIVLRDRFDAAGLGDLVVVDSTGISDEESGNPIDRRAHAVLTRHGYVVGTHRARQSRAAEVSARDLVLAMTAQHARALRRLVGFPGVVRLYRTFDPAAPRAVDAERALDIADPWYGGVRDFEDCLAEVEAGADGVVAYVRSQLGG